MNINIVEQLKEAADFCDSITNAYIMCIIHPQGWRIRCLEISSALHEERFAYARIINWVDWEQGNYTLKQLVEEVYNQYLVNLQCIRLHCKIPPTTVE